MLRFAEVFPDDVIALPAPGRLSPSAFRDR
jgi:hypothetical protein